MLDSRAPPGEKYSYQEQEAERERKIEEEAKRLMAETRLWRLANSAQWVAWGIVQANIPGLPNFDKEKPTNVDAAARPQNTSSKATELESATAEARVAAANDKQNEEEEEGKKGMDDAQSEEEEFDYLGYAQERAMFFWGDAIKLGIVKEEEIPKDLRKMVKIVEY
jgi:choline kinase